MLKNKLKIGLLVDDHKVPLWAYKLVEHIELSDHSEVSLIVIRKQTAKQKLSVFKKLWKKRNELLFKAYSKLDKKLNKCSPDAFEAKDLLKIVNCQEIVVQPKETKYSDRILDDDLKKIKEYEIDVFIRLGFRILRGAILKTAKYGVWSYHHGDYKENRGGPAGVWEVFNGWNQTGVLLQILTEDLDNGVILFEANSNTNKYSVNKNRNNFYWKAKSFIPRKLKELYNAGPDQFFEEVKAINSYPLFYSNRLYTTPGNLESIKGFLRIGRNKIKELIDRYFYSRQWVLYFNFEKEQKISHTLFRFKKITPPKGRHWMNPFALHKNDKHYIFFEEYLIKRNKSQIAVIEINNEGGFNAPETILESDFQLSHPFFFEEGEQLYMISENKELNRIDLYTCKCFPTNWEFKKILIDNISARSATLYFYNKKYWLFTSVISDLENAVFDELALYYTDDFLEGTWKLHPDSPIVSDDQCSRQAGNIFVFGDKIFRPAQNISKQYGEGIELKEIIKFNEKEYAEKPIQLILPNWTKGLSKTNTINFSGNLTVVDALVKGHLFS